MLQEQIAEHVNRPVSLTKWLKYRQKLKDKEVKSAHVGPQVKAGGQLSSLDLCCPEGRPPAQTALEPLKCSWWKLRSMMSVKIHKISKTKYQKMKEHKIY